MTPTGYLICGAIIALTCAVIITHSRHADRPVPYDATPAGQALADALTQHILAGGTLDDIIGGRVITHPCGAVRIELVTRTDATRVAHEAEDFLRHRGGPQ